jgi:hypothetical protein
VIGGKLAPDRVAQIAVIERGIEQRSRRVIEIGPLQHRQRDAGQQLCIVAAADDRLIPQDLTGNRLRDLLIGIVPGLDVLDGMVVERLELSARDDPADLLAVAASDSFMVSLIGIQSSWLICTSITVAFSAGF